MTGMRTQRAASVSALVAACGVLIAACAAPDVESGPATTMSVEPSPERSVAPSPPEDPQPDIVWPLTGVDAEESDPSALERPALSIKIENSDQARPQENLDSADIVFEEYVEYGISRLVAVYHSDVPDTVGPIRSMRPMDKNIMGSMEGPLIFSGAQGRFINGTVSSGQEIIAQDVGSYGFYRTSDKPAPHNLHGTTEDFFAQTDAAAPPQQFSYAYPAEESNVITGGTATTHIDITMSPRALPEWRWDESAAQWMRFEDQTPHVTTEGTQLSATNVIVLWVDVQYTSASGGTAVPETLVVTDAGTGYAVVQDAYVPITWTKAGQYDPYVLTTEDGETVTLAPGKTWVELVPQSGVGNATDVAFN